MRAGGIRIAVLAAALCCPGGPVAADADAPALEPVTLTIANGSDAVLRCTVVLAHFVTRDLAAIAPGAGLTLALERAPATGALAYGSHAGRPMWVENILCGPAVGWETGRIDLSLTPVRTGPAGAFRAACTDVGLACPVGPAE